MISEKQEQEVPVLRRRLMPHSWVTVVIFRIDTPMLALNTWVWDIPCD